VLERIILQDRKVHETCHDDHPETDWQARTRADSSREQLQAANMDVACSTDNDAESSATRMSMKASCHGDSDAVGTDMPISSSGKSRLHSLPKQTENMVASAGTSNHAVACLCLADRAESHEKRGAIQDLANE
jgi:hypothetical protein